MLQQWASADAESTKFSTENPELFIKLAIEVHLHATHPGTS